MSTDIAVTSPVLQNELKQLYRNEQSFMRVTFDSCKKHSKSWPVIDIIVLIFTI